MIRSLIVIAVLMTSKMASAHPNMRMVKKCSAIEGIIAISALELRTYQVRDYDKVTSTYMRAALQSVEDYLTVRPLMRQSNLANRLLGFVEAEISDTYRYERYRISTATSIFERLLNGAERMKAHHCTRRN